MKEGDFAKSQELYEQAADVTEGLLEHTPDDQTKSSLIATMSDVYKGDFAVAAKLGEKAEAFRIIETARGRSTADLLKYPRSQEIKLSDSDKATTAEFSFLQRSLMQTSDGTERKELLDRLFVAEQLMESRTQAVNRFEEATVHAQPIDLAKLRTVLLPDELVLEYVLADPTSYCLLLTKGKLLS